MEKVNMARRLGLFHKIYWCWLHPEAWDDAHVYTENQTNKITTVALSDDYLYPQPT